MSWEVRTMRSKTSYFNGALMRKNLTRFWPLWAVYAAAWLLAGPVTRFVTAFGRYAEPDAALRAEELIRDLLYTWTEFGMFSAVLAGVLFAMALFSYLTMPRAVGMFHSFPIRRQGLFFTNYLTGLLVAVVVQVVAAVLEAVVLLSAGAMDGAAWLGALACGLGQMLFFYSFGVLCAVFTGQILMVPVLYGVLNVLAYGLCNLVQQMCEAFYYGFRYSTPSWVVWLTPVERLGRNLSVTGDYNEVLQISANWRLEGLGTVGIYAAVGVVMMLLALTVYCRRPSETAGDTVAIQWAKPVFLWGVALCAALSLGQGLYYLVVDPLLGSWKVWFPGLLVCVVLLCLLGYWGASMLLRKSFRVLRVTWKGALAAAAVVTVLCLCVRADVLGVEDHVPALQEVESLSFEIEGYSSYYYGELEDPAEIQRFLEIHQAILAEKDHLRQWDMTSDSTMPADGFSDENSGEERLWGRLDLHYYLSDGTSVRRSYRLNYYEEELDQPDSAMAQLAELTADPVVQRQSLQVEKLLRFTGGDFIQDSTGVGLNAREAEILYEAILEDMEAGRFGRNAFRSDAWAQETYNNRLTLYYISGLDKSGDPITDSLDLEFSVNATTLLSALEDLGLTEQVPLVTYDQAREQSKTRAVG